MDKDKIIAEHPSICYNCENARKPASDVLTEKGYVGCCMFARDRRQNDSVDFIDQAKEIAEGWVDLKARPFGTKSGVITNFQILTIEVGKCAEFEKLRRP